MAARRSVLGVEIGSAELRLLRLSSDGSSVRVATHGQVALPPGAVVEGHIENAEAVGSALGQLLDSVGETSRRVFFAVPASGVVTRVLEVPPVPDQELREIVQGEVVHYNILREGVGTFDFVRMYRPGASIGAPNVLVMATDEPVLNTMREVARRAGAKVQGLEPVQMGLFRTALGVAGEGSTGCFVMLNEASTDIAIIDQGQLILYRTADHGGRTLCTGDPIDPLNLEIAGAIGMEISRSIEYYRREFPTAGHVSKVYYATNVEQAHKFAGWIRENLEMDTVEVDPRVASSDPAAVKFKLPDGHRFVGVYGIAARELPQFESSPRFDLVDRDVEGDTERSARKGLELALVASVLFLAVGIVLGWTVGSRANAEAHRLDELKQQLQQLQSTDRREAENRMEAMQQLRTLASKGAPFPQMMDIIAGSLDEGVGLSRVELDPSWRLRISGEAVNESAMIETHKRLMRDPSFSGTSIESYRSVAGINQPLAVEFELTSQYLGRFPSQQQTTGTPLLSAGGQS